MSRLEAELRSALVNLMKGRNTFVVHPDAAGGVIWSLRAAHAVEYIETRDDFTGTKVHVDLYTACSWNQIDTNAVWREFRSLTSSTLRTDPDTEEVPAPVQQEAIARTTRCCCGGETANTPHADYCPKYLEGGYGY